jgi:methenyltetrahydrofolate cyclohydrolase
VVVKMGLDHYIERVASKDRTPGGGSVAAIAASLGCALASMVANLTFEKKAFKELETDQKEAFQQGFEELQDLIQDLNQLAKDDTFAFEGVMEAMKLPKDTDEAQQKRKEAIEEATKEALETPLKTAKLSLKALELQTVFVKWGNTDTMSDIGVGIWTAYGGLEGALITVKINLYNLYDKDYKKKVMDQCDEIMKKGSQLRDQHLKEVYKKLDD